MEVSLRLLGVPAVRIADRSEPLAAERRFQLLAYLALHDAWVTRERLAHLFWPDRNEELARGNLRFTLAQIRKLPWPSGLEVRADALRWTVETDVARFEHTLATDPSAAIRLYGGPLLTGFETNAAAPFVEWLSAERRRLHGRWRDAVIARLTAEPPAAVSSPGGGPRNEVCADDRLDLTARLLHYDPLDEPVLQVYLRLLQAHGRNAEAQRAYGNFAQRLSEELGIEPSAQTRALLREAGRRNAPAVRADLAAAPSGDSDFVGRTVERRELAALLARADVRLVTLLGPGGVGKSALAQRVASDGVQRFADGTHFVALEDVPEPEGIGARIARALALALHGTAAPIEQVTDYLSARCALLVLDNFEHLAHSAPLLQDLLQRCPCLKLLVTSRVRLGLTEEAVFPLDGLPCPSIEDDHRATDFDAVRLFIERARQTRPTFDAQAQTAGIAEICRRVDGLPLAIELAAPWIRLLSCREIAEEISAGAELLRAQDPARPARQASIEATLEQSWRLLLPAERDALAKLSVFRGGFTREAAREVAGASLPVLLSLADKSLVRVERSRFSLHPLVQEFAASILESTADWGATRDKHASFFSELLVRASAMRGKDEPRSMDLIESELQNVKAAWMYALESRKAGVLKGATALGRYCDLRSKFQEGIDLLKAAETTFASEGTRLVLVWRQLATLEYLAGRLPESRTYAKKTLAAARAEGDLQSILAGLFHLGRVAIITGSWQAAARYFSSGLKTAESIQDEIGADIFRFSLARVLRETGQFEAAEQLFLRSLEFRTAREDRWRIVEALHGLGLLLTQAGRAAEAVVVLNEAFERCRESDSMKLLVCGIRCALADAYLKLGHLANAASAAERALEEAIGNEAQDLSNTHLMLARVRLRQGRLPEVHCELSLLARTAFREASVPLQMACVCVLAEMHAIVGDLNGAGEMLSAVSRHPAVTSNLVQEARSIADRFDIALDEHGHGKVSDGATFTKYLAEMLSATAAAAGAGSSAQSVTI